MLRMIVGRAVDLDAMRMPGRPLGPEKIRIEGLSGPGVKDFSVSLWEGEIVGLTGLVGTRRRRRARTNSRAP